jgi:signal transduction histidine kinase
MLHAFISANRNELDQRFRQRISGRTRRAADKQRLNHSVSVFLDQIISALQAESEQCGPRTNPISMPAANDAHNHLDRVTWPSTQGIDLLARSIDLVAQDYGDICQAIITLACELGETFDIAELQTLDHCLDNGIADAVMEFSERPDLVIGYGLRDSINTAMLALVAIKSSSMGTAGTSRRALDRNLSRLRSLIDQSRAEGHDEPGMKIHCSPFILADFIEEMKYSASGEAELHGCVLNIENIPRQILLHADKDLMFAALVNVLQNAYKFSGKGGTVTLRASASVGRIQITVKSCACNYSEYVIDDMFLPFTESGANKIGLGMGLSLARRSIEANGGLLSVESKFGQGCVFTIDLPRKAISVEG